MIFENCIKDEDFSLMLPMVIGKLEIVLCHVEGNYFDDIEHNQIAVSNILNDAIEDIKVINTALYGTETLPEPDTAPTEIEDEALELLRTE